MVFVSYKLIHDNQERALTVPGKRIQMRQDQMFGIWVAQHEYSLSAIVTSEEGHSILDVALNAWEFFPELVEEGRN